MKLRLKASLVVILTVTVVAALAPWISPFSVEQQDLEGTLQTASSAHWLGTDALGRDLFTRILFGARISLTIGVTTAFFSLLIGTLTGMFAGWRGGWIDRLIMRTTEIFNIFPMILLATLLLLVFGRGLTGMFVALAITSWISQARLVRGLVLQTRQLPYIESAQALGVTPTRILFRHILPQLWGPSLVSLTFQIPSNILTESFLSFLGLGIQPPDASWGTLAHDGYRALQTYPHLMIYPGVVLFATLLSFQFLGDALRDALDPRSPFRVS